MMTNKTIIAAVVALSVLFANGAAKWKNLADKSHISGDKLTETDLLGKVVLVYYWDLSEEKSVKNLPEVEKIWSSFKTKKFQVVGNYIGTKNDEKVKAAIQKNKVTFPVYYNFSLDPDPRVSWIKSPYFNVVNHRGVSIFGGGSVKSGTEKIVNAIGAIGKPISLCEDVSFKKLKGFASQLKLGNNLATVVKKLEKETHSRDPNVASEAQEILSAIDSAKDEIKADIEIYKQVDPAEAAKIVELFLKTWPKDESAAELKLSLKDLKKAAKDKAKAAKDKDKAAKDKDKAAKEKPEVGEEVKQDKEVKQSKEK